MVWPSCFLPWATWTKGTLGVLECWSGGVVEQRLEGWRPRQPECGMRNAERRVQIENCKMQIANLTSYIVHRKSRLIFPVKNAGFHSQPKSHPHIQSGLDGRTVGVDTLRLPDIRPVGSREMVHARPFA